MILEPIVLSITLGLCSGAITNRDGDIGAISIQGYEHCLESQIPWIGAVKKEFCLPAIKPTNCNDEAWTLLNSVSPGLVGCYGDLEKDLSLEERQSVRPIQCEEENDNEYFQPQRCVCPASQSLSVFKSVLEARKFLWLDLSIIKHRDRKWTIRCQYIPGTSENKPFYQNKVWGPRNGVGSYFDYQHFEAPANHEFVSFIVGMESTPMKMLKLWHNIPFYSLIDRVYKFKWQSSHIHKLKDCQWSGALNVYEQAISKTVEEDEVITGVKSWFFSPEKGDRRFEIRICKLVPRCSEITDVTYNMTALTLTKGMKEAGHFVSKNLLKHNHNGQIKSSVDKAISKSLGNSYEYKYGKSWQNTASLEVMAGVSFGIPGTAGAEASITASFSSTWATTKEWTRQQSKSLTETAAYKVEFIDTCTAYHYCTAVVEVNNGVVNIPYTITSRTKSEDGDRCTEEGVMTVQHSWNIHSEMVSYNQTEYDAAVADGTIKLKGILPQ